ncbi:hypothetical protein P8452_28081 [Trifolium repens]|nr:hypothetical protein P8452_28081 [Trifolium repens]
MPCNFLKGWTVGGRRVQKLCPTKTLLRNYLQMELTFCVIKVENGVGTILNSSIQLTLLSKNPNQKVSIYYDEFQVYATYKNQQITSDSFVPPFYQEQQESNLLSSSLIGNGLLVAPSIGYELGHDQISGRLSLNLKANGKLRWKIGTWVSGRYRFNVNCVSVVTFGIGNSMNVPPLTSKQGALCSTTI